MNPDELADLRTRGRTRRWPSGAILFREGDASDEVHLVEAGHLKVFCTGENGQELTLAVLGVGELVGELAALDHLPRSATVCALEPASTTEVTGVAFEQFLSAHPRTTITLLRILAHRLRDADVRGLEYATLDLPGRLAARLVELAVKFGEPSDEGTDAVEISVSHDDLAAWTASTREAVSKAMALFRANGWVASGRKRTIITDVVALRCRSQHSQRL